MIEEGGDYSSSEQEEYTAADEANFEYEECKDIRWLDLNNYTVFEYSWQGKSLEYSRYNFTGNECKRHDVAPFDEANTTCVEPLDENAFRRLLNCSLSRFRERAISRHLHPRSNLFMKTKSMTQALHLDNRRSSK